MPEIRVNPHGDRWAVTPPGRDTPASEHETREEAESAARRLADELGATVAVSDSDESGLGAAEDTAAKEPSGGPPPSPGAHEPAETARQPQAGF